MVLPIKNTLYKYTQKWPKYIIIHHTDELEINDGSILFDKPTYQFNRLARSYYEMDKMYLPYNFVIEKIGDEFQPIVSAPLLTKHEYLDMEDVHQDSIHIGILGNYNADTVELKLYDVLALRVIIPLMRTFRIPEENVVLHSDISLDPESSCPGSFFSLSKLKNTIRANIKKKSVSRA